MPSNRSDQASVFLALRNLTRRVAILEANPIVGLGGDYVFLSEQTVSVGGSSITFSAIPQTYRHLRVDALLGGIEGNEKPLVQWNSYVAANYDTRGILNLDGVSSAYSAAAIGVRPTLSLTEGIYDSRVGTNFLFDFPYYSVPNPSALGDAAVQAVFFSGFGISAGDASSPGVWQTTGGGFYSAETAADTITAITLTTLTGAGFCAGSRASLYGIR